ADLITKQIITVANGVVGAVITDTVVVFPGEKLYLEYYTDSAHLANQISASQALLDTNGTDFTVNCGFHTVDTTIIFGSMYRHWGQFAYNGNRDRATQPIIESDLVLPPSFNTPTDPASIDLSGGADADAMQSNYNGAGG